MELAHSEERWRGMVEALDRELAKKAGWTRALRRERERERALLDATRSDAEQQVCCAARRRA